MAIVMTLNTSFIFIVLIFAREFVWWALKYSTYCFNLHRDLREGDLKLLITLCVSLLKKAHRYKKSSSNEACHATALPKTNFCRDRSLEACPSKGFAFRRSGCTQPRRVIFLFTSLLRRYVLLA